MAKTKVAVTLDSQTLRRVDRLVRDARYPNRSPRLPKRSWVKISQIRFLGPDDMTPSLLWRSDP